MSAALKPDDEPAPEPPRLEGSLLARRFLITEEIGRGGMAIVYRAKQLALDRDVALKVATLPYADPRALEHLRTEAQTASRIEHDNVLRIYDSGEFHERRIDGFFMAMELVDGDSLYDELGEEEPLGDYPEGLAWTVEVMAQVLDAVSATHEQGIVHCDIKPGNILLVDVDDGEGDTRLRVKLCDYGIAQTMENAFVHGPTGLVGTPSYISPEQILTNPVDERTDVYACGVLLFEMLTGQLPFEGEDLEQVTQHLTSPPPRPSEIVPGLPRGLDLVIARALQKDPDDRYKSARAMRDALIASTETYFESTGTYPAIDLQTIPIKPPRQSWLPQAPAMPRFKPQVLTAALAALALFTVVPATSYAPAQPLAIQSSTDATPIAADRSLDPSLGSSLANADALSSYADPSHDLAPLEGDELIPIGVDVPRGDEAAAPLELGLTIVPLTHRPAYRVESNAKDAGDEGGLTWFDVHQRPYSPGESSVVASLVSGSI